MISAMASESLAHHYVSKDATQGRFQGRHVEIVSEETPGCSCGFLSAISSLFQSFLNLLSNLFSRCSSKPSDDEPVLQPGRVEVVALQDKKAERSAQSLERVLHAPRIEVVAPRVDIETQSWLRGLCDDYRAKVIDQKLFRAVIEEMIEVGIPGIMIPTNKCYRGTFLPRVIRLCENRNRTFQANILKAKAILDQTRSDIFHQKTMDSLKERFIEEFMPCQFQSGNRSISRDASALKQLLHRWKSFEKRLNEIRNLRSEEVHKIGDFHNIPPRLINEIFHSILRSPEELFEIANSQDLFRALKNAMDNRLATLNLTYLREILTPRLSEEWANELIYYSLLSTVSTECSTGQVAIDPLHLDALIENLDERLQNLRPLFEREGAISSEDARKIPVEFRTGITPVIILLNADRDLDTLVNTLWLHGIELESMKEIMGEKEAYAHILATIKRERADIAQFISRYLKVGLKGLSHIVLSSDLKTLQSKQRVRSELMRECRHRWLSQKIHYEEILPEDEEAPDPRILRDLARIVSVWPVNTLFVLDTTGTLFPMDEYWEQDFTVYHMLRSQYQFLQQLEPGSARYTKVVERICR